MASPHALEDLRRGEPHGIKRWGAESLWWYASFVFPGVAGTLGPMAAAFSICALIRPWVLVQAPEDFEEVGSNQLRAVNAVQVSIAVVSNVMLLRNMARRARYSISQPLTLAGWYVSSFCLVAIIVTASRLAAAGTNPEYHWSQSYYYCIYAATIYFVIAALMSVNFFGARRGHYKHDVSLSTTLRLLMLHSIIFLVIILLGALVFARIEGWSYLDSVYWADVTLLTIGFGDITPTTTLGRALLFPYTISGVICLGLTITSIRRLVLDKGNQARNERVMRKIRDDYLRGMMNDGDTIPLEDPQQLQTMFTKLREIRSRVMHRRRWTDFAISLCVWHIFLFGGGAIFTICERPYRDFSYFDGLYMTFVSLTTIGYGDFTPTSTSGRSFFVLWSLLAVPTVTILVANAQDTLVEVLRTITLFFGSVSLFPGEAGFKGEARGLLLKLGFKSRGHDSQVSQMARRNHIHQNQPREMPASRRRFQILLLEEITRIITDLHNQMPQHYPIDRWLWYIKILQGFDNITGTHDASQLRHEGSNPDEPAHMSETSRPSDTTRATYVRSQGCRWELSELSATSPLMGPKEEAEWILQKLLETLKNELADVCKYEEEGSVVQ